MTEVPNRDVAELIDAATGFVRDVAGNTANLYVTGSIARHEFGFFAEVGGVSDVDLVVSTAEPVGEYHPVMGLRPFLGAFDDRIQSSVCFVESGRVAGLRSSFAVDLGRKNATAYTGFKEDVPSHRLDRADCFEVFVHQLGLFYTRQTGIEYSRQESPRDTVMHLRKAVFELGRAALVEDFVNPTYTTVLNEAGSLSAELGTVVKEVATSRTVATSAIETVLRSGLKQIWDAASEPFPVFDDCSLCTYAYAVLDMLGVAGSVAPFSGSESHVAEESTWATKGGVYLRWTQQQGRVDRKSAFEAKRKDYFLARHAVMCGYTREFCSGGHDR